MDLILLHVFTPILSNPPLMSLSAINHIGLFGYRSIILFTTGSKLCTLNVVMAQNVVASITSLRASYTLAQVAYPSPIKNKSQSAKVIHWFKPMKYIDCLALLPLTIYLSVAPFSGFCGKIC